MTESITDRIRKEVQSHKVVLFVKGTAAAPQCGFSASAMELFKDLNVSFHAVDILASPDLRFELPKYSNWPTFPQVFINGKFVGGADIVHELHESGELEKLLQ